MNRGVDLGGTPALNFASSCTRACTNSTRLPAMRSMRHVAPPGHAAARPANRGRLLACPLDNEQTHAYIRHRLGFAGSGREDLFTADACDAIFVP